MSNTNGTHRTFVAEDASSSPEDSDEASKEAQVGISYYLSPGFAGFRGTLKKR